MQMTTNEILDSLRVSLRGKPDSEGLTTREWMKQFSIRSEQRARDEIRALVEAGRLTVIRPLRRSMNGVIAPVWAYRPAPSKGKK